MTGRAGLMSERLSVRMVIIKNVLLFFHKSNSILILICDVYWNKLAS